MNKDVIYIDVEDDITGIIGKIRASKERIVALVPPKRVGLLQSAVNLRLLSRMAETSNKKLVIVTNSKSLTALAATAMIPIAKNLQSKPELATVEDDDLQPDGDGEEIIDGVKLPIGELAKTADEPVDESVDEAVDTINVDDLEAARDDNKAKSPDSKKTSSAVKIPDFHKFRKRLFLSITLVVGLTVFLVWAIKYAPAARVIITTRTTQAPVSATVNIGGTQATDVSKNVIQTVTKQIKKDVSVEFVATGSKTVGVKATGTLTLANAKSSNSISVPAGSVFSNGSNSYTTNATVIVPGATVVEGVVQPGTISVNITAIEIGAAYNSDPADYTSSINGITAAGGKVENGESHLATIVTAADVQKASQTIVDMTTTAERAALIKQFTNGESIINDSLYVDRAEAVSVPAVGAEVTGKAKLTSATTYSMTAIAKSELDTFLKATIKKQITDTKTQRLYDDGTDDVVLSGYSKTDQGATINIATTGKIGPNINEAYVKQHVKGKKFGDIQSSLQQIDGVSDVEVKFSYFWVSTVPDDISKIDVEFKASNVE